VTARTPGGQVIRLNLQRMIVYKVFVQSKSDLAPLENSRDSSRLIFMRPENSAADALSCQGMEEYR